MAKVNGNKNVSADYQIVNGKKVKKQEQPKNQKQVFNNQGQKTPQKPNDSAIKQEVYKKSGYQLKDTTDRGKIIQLKVNGKIRSYKTVGTLTTGGRILVQDEKGAYHVVSHTKDNKLVMLKDDYAKNKIFYESTSSEHKVKYGKKNYVITNAKRDRHGRMSAVDENGKRVVLSSDGKELKTGYVEAEDQKDNMNDYIAKATKGKSKEEAAKIRQQILGGNSSYANKGVLRFKASNGEVWYYDTKRKTYVKYADKEAQAIIKDLDKGATENWGLFRTSLGTDYELLKNTNAQIIDPEVLGKVNKHYSAEYGNKVDKNAQYGSGKYRTAYEAFLASEIGDDEVYQFNATLVKNNAITDQTRRNEILQTNLTKVGSRANRLAAADAASRKEDYQTLQDAAEEENKKKNYKAQFKGSDALQTYIYGVNKGDVQEIDDFNTTLIDPKEDMLDRDEIVKIKAETGALWAKQGKYDKAFDAQDSEVVDKMFALQDANGKTSLNVKELKAKGYQGEYLMFAKPELFTEQELADKAVSMLTIALDQFDFIEKQNTMQSESVLFNLAHNSRDPVAAAMSENATKNSSKNAIEASISKAYTLIRNDKVLNLVKQKMGDKFNLLQKKEQAMFKTNTFANVTIKNDNVKSNLSAEEVAQNKYVVSWLKSQLEDLERDKKLNEAKEGWKQTAVDAMRTSLRAGETRESLANKYDLIKSNMARLEAAAEGKLVDKNGKPVTFEDAMKNLGETGIKALEKANQDYQSAQATGEFVVDMAVLAIPIPGLSAGNIVRMAGTLYKVVGTTLKGYKVVKVTAEAVKGQKIINYTTKVVSKVGEKAVDFAVKHPTLTKSANYAVKTAESSATGAMHMAGKTVALDATNIATSREGFTADRISEMNEKTKGAALFGGMGGAIGGTTAVASEFVSSAGAKYAVHGVGLVADLMGAAGLMTAESHGETNFWDNLRCVNPDGSFNFEQASMTAMMIFGHLHGMSAIKGKPMPKAEIQADGTVKYTLNNNELKLNKDGIYTDSETGRKFKLATNKNSKTELVELTKKEVAARHSEAPAEESRGTASQQIKSFKERINNAKTREELNAIRSEIKKTDLTVQERNELMAESLKVQREWGQSPERRQIVNMATEGDNVKLTKKDFERIRNQHDIKQTKKGSKFEYSGDENTIIITEMLGKKEVAKYEIMSDENGKPFIRKPDEYGRGDDATFYPLMTEKNLTEILKEFDIKPTQEGSVFRAMNNGRSIEIYEIKGKEFVYSYRLELDTKGKPHIVERKPIDLNQKTTEEAKKPVAGEGSEVSEGAKQSVEIPKKLSDVNSFVEEYPDFVKSEADGVVTITNKKANLTIEYDKNTGKKVVATQVDQDGLVVRNTFNENGSIATRESDFVYEGNRYHEFYDVNKGTKSYQQILDKNTGISTEVKPELAKKFAEGTVDDGKFTPKEEVVENAGESNTPKLTMTIEEAKKLAKFENVEVKEQGKDNFDIEIKFTDENNQISQISKLEYKNGKLTKEIIKNEEGTTENVYKNGELVETITRDATGTIENVYRDGELAEITEYEYQNGKVVKSIKEQLKNDEVVSSTESEYNDGNVVKSTKSEYEKGELVGITESEYKDGNLVEETWVSADGNKTKITKNEYKDGTLIKSREELKTNNITEITEKEYKDGNVVKDRITNENGINEGEYNKDNKLIKETIKDVNGNITEIRKFEYKDQNFRPTKQTQTQYKDGKVVKITEYEFDDGYKLIKTTQKDADGNITQVTEKEYSKINGTPTKETKTQFKDGKPTEITETEYKDLTPIKEINKDADGKVTKIYDHKLQRDLTPEEIKDYLSNKDNNIQTPDGNPAVENNGDAIQSKNRFTDNNMSSEKIVADETPINELNNSELESKINALSKEIQIAKQKKARVTDLKNIRRDAKKLATERGFKFDNQGKIVERPQENVVVSPADGVTPSVKITADKIIINGKEQSIPTFEEAQNTLKHEGGKDYSIKIGEPDNKLVLNYDDNGNFKGSIEQINNEKGKALKDTCRNADGTLDKTVDYFYTNDGESVRIERDSNDKPTKIEWGVRKITFDKEGKASYEVTNEKNETVTKPIEEAFKDSPELKPLLEQQGIKLVEKKAEPVAEASVENANEGQPVTKKSLENDIKNIETQKDAEEYIAKLNEAKDNGKITEAEYADFVEKAGEKLNAEDAAQIHNEPTSTAQVKNLEKYDIMFQSKEGKALLDKAKKDPNFGKTVEERVPSDKIVKDADGNIQSIEIDGVTYTRNEQGEYVNEKGDSQIQIETPDQDILIIDPKVDKRIIIDKENNKILRINSDDMTIEYDSNGQPERVSSLGNTIYLSTGNSSQDLGSATVDPTGRVIRNEVSIDIEGRRYEPYFSEGSRYSDWNKDTNGQAITLELRQKTRRDLSKQIEDAQLENKGLSTTKKGRQKAYDDLRNQIEDAYNNNKISREDADNLHAELNEKAKANGLETQETPTMKAEREALAKWNEQVDALKNNLMSEIAKVDSQVTHDQMVEKIGEACKNGEIDMKRANELYDALEAKANSIDGVESLAQKAERINAELKAHENKSAEEVAKTNNNEGQPVGENSETADAKPSKISMFDKLFHRNKARLEKEVANGEEKIGDYKFNTVKDENGYVRTKTDNKNVVRQKEYFNAKGKKIKTETFDTNKNLIELTEGNVTTEYYADGDVKRVKYPNNKTVEFIYENGELTGAEYTEEISKAREFARSITAEENEFGEYEYDTIKRHTKYKYNSDPDKPHFELVDKNDNVVTDKNGKPVGTATFDSETRHWVEEGQYSSDLAPKTTNVSRGEGRFRIKLPERNKVPKNLRDENGKLREGVTQNDKGYIESITKDEVVTTKNYDSKGTLVSETTENLTKYYNKNGDVICTKEILADNKGVKITEKTKDYDLEVIQTTSHDDILKIIHHTKNENDTAKGPEEFKYNEESKVFENKRTKDSPVLKSVEYDADKHSWTIRDGEGKKLDSQNNMKESHIKRNLGIGAGVLALGVGIYGVSKLTKSDDDKEVKQPAKPTAKQTPKKTTPAPKAETKVTLDGKEGTIAEDGTLTLDGKKYPKDTDGTYAIGDKKYKVENGKLVEVVDTPDDNGETGGAAPDESPEVKGTVDGKEYTINSDGSATIGGHMYEKESDGYYHTEDGSIYGIGEDGKLVKIDKTQTGSDGSQAGSAGSATQTGSDSAQSGSAGSATQTGSDSAQSANTGATSQQTGNTNTTGNNTHVTAPAQPADSSASTRTTGTTHNDTSVTTRHTNVPAEESRVNSSRPSERSEEFRVNSSRSSEQSEESRVNSTRSSEQSEESRHTGNTPVTGGTEPTEAQIKVANALQNEISGISTQADVIAFFAKLDSAVKTGQITIKQCDDLMHQVETHVKALVEPTKVQNEQIPVQEPEFGLSEDLTPQITAPAEQKPQKKREITPMERMELTEKIRKAKTRDDIADIQQEMRQYKVFQGRKNLRRAYKAKLRAIKHQGESNAQKYDDKFNKRMEKVSDDNIKFKNAEFMKQASIDEELRKKYRDFEA